ncbi:MAG: thioredoxin family protein [Thiobacillaceae bacterium]|nr:thioredoxin family protein [Thiobacillaceae bacterium]MCX7672844.1 thioredoxin family protein [Thiobacillaceae bacterium]MDW8323858.1 thioredoxin family protein [Burkholderiales bacterium]
MRVLIALLLFLAQPVWAQQPRDPAVYFFQPKLGDLHAELETARREGKVGVLLMFEMDECPFCHRMKTQVLNQPEVQDYFRRHFLIYSIDVKGDIPITDFQGRDTTEKAFAFEQRARATPVFAFYDLEGRPIARFTGATQGVEEFLLLGRYVVEGAYKSMPFNVYKRQAAGGR